MLEQIALQKLKELKRSIAGENVPHFSYFPRFGICWHLFANTKENELRYDYLVSTFKLMNLDIDLPVEMQVFTDRHSANRHCMDCYNMYDSATITGQVRLALLDSLIEHFEKVLDKELTV